MTHLKRTALLLLAGSLGTLGLVFLEGDRIGMALMQVGARIAAAGGAPQPVTQEEIQYLAADAVTREHSFNVPGADLIELVGRYVQRKRIDQLSALDAKTILGVG